MDAAVGRARSAADFAGAWLDRLTPVPEHPERVTESDAHNNVINLRFTGDLVAREEWIREIWGGALCLSGAEHAYSELLAIQRALKDEMAAGVVVHTSPDDLTNRVSIGVWVASEEVVRRLEEKYGADAITVSGIL